MLSQPWNESCQHRHPRARVVHALPCYGGMIKPNTAPRNTINLSENKSHPELEKNELLNFLAKTKPTHANFTTLYRSSLSTSVHVDSSLGCVLFKNVWLLSKKNVKHIKETSVNEVCNGCVINLKVFIQSV